MSRYDIALGHTPKVKETRYEGGIPELMKLEQMGGRIFRCPHCHKAGFTLLRFGFKQDNPLKRFFNIDGKGRYYANYKCSNHWGCRRKLYSYIFDNNVWTCVDIVYETRWDCRIALGGAQHNPYEAG